MPDAAAARRLTDAEWELAREICTAKQLAALAWHRQGWGYRQIARMLDVAPATVRDRIVRAQQLMVLEEKRRAA